MWKPIIYIKDSYNDVNTPAMLVHEPSHALNFYKDLREGGRLSKKWKELFPKDRKGRRLDDPEFLEETGLLTSHAAIDFFIDIIPGDNYPVENTESMYFIDNKSGIRTDFHEKGFEKNFLAAKYIFSIIDQLPQQLKKSISNVVVQPHLNYQGRCIVDNRYTYPEYWNVTEDIATSTEHFYMAFHNSEPYLWVVDKVNSNKKTQRRLEVLVEEGFLDKEVLRLVV